MINRKKFWLGSLNGGDHWKYLGVGEGIILKWILGKLRLGIWTGLIWLSIGTRLSTYILESDLHKQAYPNSDVNTDTTWVRPMHYSRIFTVKNRDRSIRTRNKASETIRAQNSMRCFPKVAMSEVAGAGMFRVGRGAGRVL
jgi:hypothetical protein